MSDARQPRRRRVVIVSSVALSLLLGALVFAAVPGALADWPEPATAPVTFQSCYVEDNGWCTLLPEASLVLDGTDIGADETASLPVGSSHTLVASFHVTATRWDEEGQPPRQVTYRFCEFMGRSALSVVHFTVPDGGDYYLAQYVPQGQGCPG